MPGEPSVMQLHSLIVQRCIVGHNSATKNPAARYGRQVQPQHKACRNALHSRLTSGRRPRWSSDPASSLLRAHVSQSYTASRDCEPVFDRSVNVEFELYSTVEESVTYKIVSDSMGLVDKDDPPGLTLEADANQLWKGSCCLRTGASYTFQCICIGSDGVVHQEDGANREMLIPEDAQMVAVAIEWNKTQSTGVYAICGYKDEEGDTLGFEQPDSMTSPLPGRLWSVSKWWAHRRLRTPFTTHTLSKAVVADEPVPIVKLSSGISSGGTEPRREQPFRTSAWSAQIRRERPFPREFGQRQPAVPALQAPGRGGQLQSGRGHFLASEWAKQQRQSSKFPRSFLNRTPGKKSPGTLASDGPAAPSKFPTSSWSTKQRMSRGFPRGFQASPHPPVVQDSVLRSSVECTSNGSPITASFPTSAYVKTRRVSSPFPRGFSVGESLTGPAKCKGTHSSGPDCYVELPTAKTPQIEQKPSDGIADGLGTETIAGFIGSHKGPWRYSAWANMQRNLQMETRDR